MKILQVAMRRPKLRRRKSVRASDRAPYRVSSERAPELHQSLRTCERQGTERHPYIRAPGHASGRERHPYIRAPGHQSGRERHPYIRAPGHQSGRERHPYIRAPGHQSGRERHPYIRAPGNQSTNQSGMERHKSRRREGGVFIVEGGGFFIEIEQLQGKT